MNLQAEKQAGVTNDLDDANAKSEMDDDDVVAVNGDLNGDGKRGAEEHSDGEDEELGENEYADRNMELLRALGIVGSNFKLVKKPDAPKKKAKVFIDPATLRRTPRAVDRRNLSDLSLARFCTYCRNQGHSIKDCLQAKLDRGISAVGTRRSERRTRNKEVWSDSDEDMPIPKDDDGWD